MWPWLFCSVFKFVCLYTHQSLPSGYPIPQKLPTSAKSSITISCYSFICPTVGTANVGSNIASYKIPSIPIIIIIIFKSQNSYSRVRFIEFGYPNYPVGQRTIVFLFTLFFIQLFFFFAAIFIQLILVIISIHYYELLKLILVLGWLKIKMKLTYIYKKKCQKWLTNLLPHLIFSNYMNAMYQILSQIRLSQESLSTTWISVSIQTLPNHHHHRHRGLVVHYSTRLVFL